MIYKYVVAQRDDSRLRFLTAEDMQAVLRQFASPLEFFFHRLHGGFEASHQLQDDGAVEITLRTHRYEQAQVDALMEQFLEALNSVAPGLAFGLRERVA